MTLFYLPIANHQPAFRAYHVTRSIILNKRSIRMSIAHHFICLNPKNHKESKLWTLNAHYHFNTTYLATFSLSTQLTTINLRKHIFAISFIQVLMVLSLKIGIKNKKKTDLDVLAMIVKLHRQLNWVLPTANFLHPNFSIFNLVNGA